MPHPFDHPSPWRQLRASWLVLGMTTLMLAAPAVTIAQATASASISGRVTDARSGDAVPGATIQVEGMRLAGLAGPDGRYRIANVPAGARSLVVLRLGYASIRRAVTVSAGQDQTVEFALQASAVSLD